MTGCAGPMPTAHPVICYAVGRKACRPGGALTRPGRQFFWFPNQYATPQIIIFLAGLPQMGQVSPKCSWAKGMQRLVTPQCSFM